MVVKPRMWSGVGLVGYFFALRFGKEGGGKRRKVLGPSRGGHGSGWFRVVKERRRRREWDAYVSIIVTLNRGSRLHSTYPCRSSSSCVPHQSTLPYAPNQSPIVLVSFFPVRPSFPSFSGSFKTRSTLKVTFPKPVYDACLASASRCERGSIDKTLFLHYHMTLYWKQKRQRR
jgi:hypothetical protein